MSLYVHQSGGDIVYVIAVINQKGGVGKSTTSLSIGAGISLKGYRTLFVDLDAQGNLSYVMQAQTGAGGKNILDVLEGKVGVASATQHTDQGDVIASSPQLVGADTSITGRGREYRLKDALSKLKELYDCVIIDTPPALGVITVNALTAASGAIIPAQADIFSLQGISSLYGTIHTVQRYSNPTLAVLGIVLTRYNNRAIIGREVADKIDQTAQQLNTKLFTTKIRESTSIKESQAIRQSIFAYAPKSNAALDYADLVEEILREVTLS